MLGVRQILRILRVLNIRRNSISNPQSMTSKTFVRAARLEYTQMIQSASYHRLDSSAPEEAHRSQERVDQKGNLYMGMNCS